ncbi:MAG: S41 family peptidase, partial [Pseudomonadota bacterium]
TILMSRCLMAFVAVLAIVSSTPSSHAEPSPGFSNDAAIVRAGLSELYPSLDRFDQQEDVLRALDRLDEIASQTNDANAFYRAVAAVAAATRDEHVIPFPSEKFRQDRRDGRTLLPYTLQWFEGQPFVRDVADPAHSALVGQEVLQFDGNDASDVALVLRATIPSDGNSATFALRHLQDFTPTQNENYFDLNYPIWFGARERYTLKTRNKRGEVTESSLQGLEWPEFEAFYRSRLLRMPPMSFEWLKEDVGYLEVLSFHDWYYAEHDLDPRAFLTRVFDELNKRPDAGLILDLRRNEGGGDISSMLLDHVLLSPFLEYDTVMTRFVGQPDAARFCENAEDVSFRPEWADPRPDGLYQLRPEFRGLITGASERTPQPNAFDGKLVVLISGGTGSAAAKVAAVLDREARASFVGEETGGTAAGATAYGYCTLALPASKIKLTIPLIRFERKTEMTYGRGVLPDLEVDAGSILPLFDDDRVLRTAEQLFEKSHK